MADGLFTPLSLAVSKDDKKLWFSQNFAGLLMKSKGGAEPQVVYAADEAPRSALSPPAGKGATLRDHVAATVSPRTLMGDLAAG